MTLTNAVRTIKVIVANWSMTKETILIVIRTNTTFLLLLISFQNLLNVGVFLSY